MRAVRTVCPYCGAGCGLCCDVQDESNEIVEVHGITEHPVSHGSLCVKGKTAHEFVRHPDRLTRPLKRLRGSTGFIPLSWHQALTEIAAKLLEIINRDSLRHHLRAATALAASPVEPA